MQGHDIKVEVTLNARPWHFYGTVFF